MNKILSCLIVLLLVIYGCENDNGSYGFVLFYTNAQVMVNCGPFDLLVYIDNKLAGVLEQPFLPLDSVPACNSDNSSSLLILKKETGKYNYNTTFRPGLSDWTGEFEIKKDSCTKVYIDLRQMSEQ